MIEIKEILQESDWHPERIVDHTPIPQTWWYGEAQQRRGWHVKRFEVNRDGTPALYVQFICYPLLSTLTYWYSPYGPVMQSVDEEVLTKLRDELIRLEADNSVVFIRFDFFPAIFGESIDKVSKILSRASQSSSEGSYYQPRREWYTDISISSDQILSNMHQKARYSVRFAEKKGVETSVVAGPDMTTRLKSFMDLMSATAKRNGFTLHDYNYYKAFLDIVSERRNGFIVEAMHEGELLASHLVIVEGNVAHYVFGGTSDNKKELCAPYVAHFVGMKEAKLLGATQYNFGAISDNDKSTHWAGVTAFKKRFGGQIMPHSPYFDLVMKPIWYHVYNFRKFVKGILN